MVYPDSFFNQFKYWFWSVYARFYPLIRSTLYHLGISKLIIKYVDQDTGHPGRQQFLVGTIHPEKSARELALYLVEQGFGNHFVAWKDSGEIASLRRTEGFEYQYHLRIFTDGEVRCHYEYTPEYHPILHLLQIGFEDRTPEFLELLEGWIVPVTPEEV